MANPLQIIIQIVFLIIQSIVTTTIDILFKIGELFVSLFGIASSGVVGLLLASIIGGVVLYFILKFILGETKMLFILLVIYVILVGIALITLTI